MKKVFLSFLVIIVADCMMQGVLPGKGISGLINGMNIKIDYTLLLADFLLYSIICFCIYGNAESYLQGYGNYQILRLGKRDILFWKIVLNGFLGSIFFCIFKTFIYICLLFLKHNKIIDVSKKEIMLYVLIDLLVVFFSIIYQMIVEIRMNSIVGLLIALGYYIVSIVLGAWFLENEEYSIIFFLIPNYHMKYRTELFGNHFFNINMIYVILGILIMAETLILWKVIIKKEIF